MHLWPPNGFKYKNWDYILVDNYNDDKDESDNDDKDELWNGIRMKSWKKPSGHLRVQSQCTCDLPMAKSKNSFTIAPHKTLELIDKDLKNVKKEFFALIWFKVKLLGKTWWRARVEF